MVDSWGKGNDGLLMGLPFVLSTGVYDECLSVGNMGWDEEGAIQGRYCSLLQM